MKETNKPLLVSTLVALAVSIGVYVNGKTVIVGIVISILSIALAVWLGTVISRSGKS